MKLLFFLITLIFFPAAVFSQELSPTFSSGNTAVDALCQQSHDAVLKNKNNLEALQLAEKAKQLAMKSGDNLATAKANAAFAWIFSESKDYDSAVRFAEKAKALINPEKNIDAAGSIHHQLGVIYEKKSDAKSALKHYLEAAKLYREAKNPKREGQVYVEISRLYLITNDEASFKKYYMMSREMLKKYPNTKLTLSLNSQQNMVLMDAKKYQEAYKLNMESATMAQEFNYKKEATTSLYNAAGALFEMGKHDEALTLVDKVIDYSKKNGLDYADHLVGKSMILLGSGKNKEAQEMLETSVRELHQSKNKYMEMKARKLLSDLYKKNGQNDKAATEFMAYKNLEDSIAGVQQAVALKEVEYRYKDDEKEQLLQGYRDSARLKNWLVALVGAVGAMAIYLVLNARRNLRFRQNYFEKKEELLEAEKLNALREKELAQKEEEKAVLSRQLLQEEQNHLKAEKENTDRELATIALYVQEKNKLLEELQQKMDSLLQNSAPENREKLLEISKNVRQSISFEKDWDKIKLHFEKVHPEFFSRLAQQFPALTQNELKHCAYIKMSMSNKETANLLGVDHNTVKMSRYRIKKKINLAQDEDLSKFIHQI